MKKVQHDLDDKVIEIAQKLEEGDSSRKALVERTKEFRKSLTEDQRKLIAPLLKQFQQEVDGSTKRSKFMEQVLLSLYKQLIDLPDPTPALENAELKYKRAEKMTVTLQNTFNESRSINCSDNYILHEIWKFLIDFGRHMHSKILTGLSLGLSFKFFEYLSFEFEYFENLLQILNKII